MALCYIIQPLVVYLKHLKPGKLVSKADRWPLWFQMTTRTLTWLQNERGGEAAQPSHFGMCGIYLSPREGSGCYLKTGGPSMSFGDQLPWSQMFQIKTGAELCDFVQGCCSKA